MGTVMKGIQEPYAKRSVEGDIGMRYSVHVFLEAVGDRRLSKIAGINRQKVNELVDYLSNHTDYIPDNEEMEKMDYALACAAVETAVSRACRFSGTGLYTMWFNVFTKRQGFA